MIFWDANGRLLMPAPVLGERELAKPHIASSLLAGSQLALGPLPSHYLEATHRTSKMKTIINIIMGGCNSEKK